jgi:hypothetical protein
VRTRRQQRIDQVGAGIEQVLAVIEHEQKLPVGERFLERFH